MKRILALAMTLVMLFSLAGCAFGNSDAIVAKKIVGSWISEEIDITEEIIDEIEAEVSSTLGQYEEIDRDSLPDCSFTLQLCLDIESSGRFSLYCADPEPETLDSLTPVVEDIFRNALDASLAEELAAEDSTIEDLYAELGVDDFDSAIELILGMSISEFVDALGLSDILSQAFNASSRGTFTVENGVILFDDSSDELIACTYNGKDDTITDDDGYIFTRVS